MLTAVELIGKVNTVGHIITDVALFYTVFTVVTLKVTYSTRWHLTGVLASLKFRFGSCENAKMK